MHILRLILSIAILALAGCASYRPRPLDLRPAERHDLAGLTVDASRMPLPELAAHRFDPSDGLDMTEVAMLAVVNNPDLRIARDEAGIARAEAFDAGLLPDPQAAASVDAPTNNIPGSNYTAYSFGLNYDLGALLVRPAARGAAEAASRKVDLTLLWQEWQVVARARLLFVRSLEQERLLAVMREQRELLARRYRHAQQALKEGIATLDGVSADYVALQDVGTRIAEGERQATGNRFELNALLGLAPEVRLQLVGETMLPDIDREGIRGQLPRLAARRPDLLALQAGYESQDLRLREAIIRQFPSITLGLTRGSDTSNSKTIGVGITMSLPIFNRNRGKVAVEEATRKRLYDEFENRLAGAHAEIEQILADQVLLQKQSAVLREEIANLERAVAAAEIALVSGNITEQVYVSLRGGLLDKREEAISLERQLLEQRVALLTLLGGEIPRGASNGREP